MERFSHVGADADAVAALSLVRALIRTLKTAGTLSAGDVHAIFNDATDQISHGGPGRKFIGGRGLIEQLAVPSTR